MWGSWLVRRQPFFFMVDRSFWVSPVSLLQDVIWTATKPFLCGIWVRPGPAALELEVLGFHDSISLPLWLSSLKMARKELKTPAS